MIQSNQYPQVAFCLAITPATSDYYQSLKKMNINTVSICLYISQMGRQKYVTDHVNAARHAGMVTHAYMISDLHDIVSDVIQFTERFNELGYSDDSKITIFISSNRYVENRQKHILNMITLLSRYHKRENIDVAFFNDDLHDDLYDLNNFQNVNLTIVDVDSVNPGVPDAGTWIYTMDCSSNSQFLAYDYYGYYTSGGYQLSLIDTDYVVQQGDSWYSISRRHGIPLIKLLEMNESSSDDNVYAGQVVRIA